MGYDIPKHIPERHTDEQAPQTCAAKELCPIGEGCDGSQEQHNLGTIYESVMSYTDDLNSALFAKELYENGMDPIEAILAANQRFNELANKPENKPVEPTPNKETPKSELELSFEARKAGMKPEDFAQIHNEQAATKAALTSGAKEVTREIKHQLRISGDSVDVIDSSGQSLLSQLPESSEEEGTKTRSDYADLFKGFAYGHSVRMECYVKGKLVGYDCFDYDPETNEVTRYLVLLQEVHGVEESTEEGEQKKQPDIPANEAKIQDQDSTLPEDAPDKANTTANNQQGQQENASTDTGNNISVDRNTNHTTNGENQNNSAGNGNNESSPDLEPIEYQDDHLDSDLAEDLLTTKISRTNTSIEHFRFLMDSQNNNAGSKEAAGKTVKENAEHNDRDDHKEYRGHDKQQEYEEHQHQRDNIFGSNETGQEKSTAAGSATTKSAHAMEKAPAFSGISLENNSNILQNFVGSPNSTPDNQGPALRIDAQTKETTTTTATKIATETGISLAAVKSTVETQTIYVDHAGSSESISINRNIDSAVSTVEPSTSFFADKQYIEQSAFGFIDKGPNGGDQDIKDSHHHTTFVKRTDGYVPALRALMQESGISLNESPTLSENPGSGLAGQNNHTNQRESFVSSKPETAAIKLDRPVVTIKNPPSPTQRKVDFVPRPVQRAPQYIERTGPQSPDDQPQPGAAINPAEKFRQEIYNEGAKFVATFNRAISELLAINPSHAHELNAMRMPKIEQSENITAAQIYSQVTERYTKLRQKYESLAATEQRSAKQPQAGRGILDLAEEKPYQIRRRPLVPRAERNLRIAA